MNKNSSKNQQIIKTETITEKVKFQGKYITRERVIKKIEMPKIITSDIGFQLQFGMKSTDKASTTHNHLESFDLGSRLRGDY
tara:strand:- start:8 stop:253 length:246 start_codon:yes stop_codon:yes gene_type:complete